MESCSSASTSTERRRRREKKGCFSGDRVHKGEEGRGDFHSEIKLHRQPTGRHSSLAQGPFNTLIRHKDLFSGRKRVCLLVFRGYLLKSHIRINLGCHLWCLRAKYGLQCRYISPTRPIQSDSVIERVCCYNTTHVVPLILQIPGSSAGITAHESGQAVC